MGTATSKLPSPTSLGGNGPARSSRVGLSRGLPFYASAEAGRSYSPLTFSVNTDEYVYQWAIVQLVGNAVPLVLDARPVRKGESRKEIVKDLLDCAEDLVHVDSPDGPRVR